MDNEGKFGEPHELYSDGDDWVLKKPDGADAGGEVPTDVMQGDDLEKYIKSGDFVGSYVCSLFVGPDAPSPE